jgi:4-oxalocrotonate tautomerase
MPLVRIALPADTSQAHQVAISESIHEALVEKFNVPLADKFQIVSRCRPEELICTEEFLGVKHSTNVVMIQIACSFGRSVDVKKALYLKIAENIAERTSLSRSDVIINLLETAKENWSFGNGVAHYA